MKIIDAMLKSIGVIVIIAIIVVSDINVNIDGETVISWVHSED